MNSFWRKKYRAEAAKWALEGRRAMSVQPAHLLELLQEPTSQPSPSEWERRVVGMRSEVQGLRAQLQSETDRANRAHADGYAKATLENTEELKRLRAANAAFQARDQLKT